VPQFGATYIQGRSNPLHVLTADLDGDSIDEAIVTGSSNARVYNLNDGSSNLIIGSADAFMSAMADLDGDGKQELVLVGNGIGIEVFPVSLDGTVGAGISFNGLDITDPQAAVVADFDLDGRDDLAVTIASNTSAYILRGVDGLGLSIGELLMGRVVPIPFDPQRLILMAMVCQTWRSVILVRI